MQTEKLKQQLMERLKENYAEYQTELFIRERQELIDRAERIADTKNIFMYMTEIHNFSEEELSHLLQFQNPLEVICNLLHEAGQKWDDYTIFDLMSFVNLIDTSSLKLYPLVTDTKSNKEVMQKFMNVDIKASLTQLMGQITIHYQKDLTYALEAMQNSIYSDSVEDRNFVVLFRRNGVECLNERNIFIGSENGEDRHDVTSNYNTCQYYHTRTNELVLAYSVEITKLEKGVLHGNLYEQDIHQLAEFAKRTASPYTDMTLIFDTGRAQRIPQKDYNYETRNALEYKYGRIIKVHNEAEDESVVQGALRREHERRERLPKGQIKVHIQKLADKRIQAEADNIMKKLQKVKPWKWEESNPTCEVSVSEDFMSLSCLYDKKRLLEKIPYPYLMKDAEQGWEEGKSRIVFVRPLVQEQEKTEYKPSIKDRLSNPPVVKETVSKKNKDRGER